MEFTTAGHRHGLYTAEDKTVFIGFMIINFTIIGLNLLLLGKKDITK